MKSATPLTGTDYFLLALDKDMRAQSDQRYISRIALTFDQQPQLDELRETIHSSQPLRWLASAKLAKGLPLQVPRWVSQSTKTCSFAIHDRFTARWLDSKLPQHETVRFDYFVTPVPTLIFTWLHTLMDAHGAEALLKSLSDAKLTAKARWQADQPQHKLLTQLNDAKSAKEFMMDRTAGHLVLPIQAKTPPSDFTTKHRVLRFSVDETNAINAQCTRLGAKFRKSPFFLSACVHSTKGTCHPLEEQDYMLTPVPQDQRRRGAIGPVVSNQVSFMFYRFAQADLTSLSDTVQSATRQMMQQMRAQSFKSYANMMSLFRRLPMPIYRHLIKGPTSGRMASFYFSDTGSSLDGLDEFFQAQVKYMTHYPPNSYPPGLTYIFSTYRRQLQVTCAYLAQAFSEEHMDELTQHLRTLLIDGQASA